MDDPKTLIAIYAAIVATGALFLNVRTWFETGPRLKVTVIPDGMVIGPGPQSDEQDLVIATVTNIGKTPVLITSLLLWEMPTWWARLRRKPTRALAFCAAVPTRSAFPHRTAGGRSCGES